MVRVSHTVNIQKVFVGRREGGLAGRRGAGTCCFQGGDPPPRPGSGRREDHSIAVTNTEFCCQTLVWIQSGQFLAH